MGVIELVAGVFKPAAELVDELHTSEEERLKAKGHLLDVQAAAMQRVFDYEAESLKAKSGIVAAEAQSEHWITATWRPITMLTFLSLAVGDSLGWLPNPLRDEAWTLLQIGLGGYVVARSGEKIVTAVKKHQ
jgi:hypothetical protein